MRVELGACDARRALARLRPPPRSTLRRRTAAGTERPTTVSLPPFTQVSYPEQACWRLVVLEVRLYPSACMFPRSPLRA